MEKVQKLKLHNGRFVDVSTANGLTAYCVDKMRIDGAFAQRINVIPVHGRRATNTGFPDVFALYRGWFVGVEIKMGRDKQHPEQIQWEQNCIKAGGYYVIIHNVAEFADFWAKFKRMRRTYNTRLTALGVRAGVIDRGSVCSSRDAFFSDLVGTLETLNPDDITATADPDNTDPDTMGADAVQSGSTANPDNQQEQKIEYHKYTVRRG